MDTKIAAVLESTLFNLLLTQALKRYRTKCAGEYDD